MNATEGLKNRVALIRLLGEMMPVYAQEHQRLLYGCQTPKMCNGINGRAVVDSFRFLVINTHLLFTRFCFVWPERPVAGGDIRYYFVFPCHPRS